MNPAATNRFSTKIFIDKPDRFAIEKALNLWLKKNPSAKELLADKNAIEDIAVDLVGYGYRDLQNIKDNVSDIWRYGKMSIPSEELFADFPSS